jgi:tetratricopeptide (TPR) repeat protein
VLRDGDLDAGRAILTEAVRAGAFLEDDVFGPYAWLVIDRLSRDFDSASRRVRDEGWDPVESQFFYWPAAFILGEYHRFAGRHVEAGAAYRAAEAELVDQLAQRPDDPRLHSTLGRVYAGLGERTPALEHGQHAVSLMPVENEAYRGTFILEDLAAIHATVGDQDEAVRLLERVADLPTYLSAHVLRLDPVWDALRSHPRFEETVGTYP